MGPCDLTNVLDKLAPVIDPRLLVGTETLDDAAVVKISDDLAICLTADFITPVVDDPAEWGRIAAANSLSDIYAMGATPLAALNLVCWPSTLSQDMLTDVLRGGGAAATEAKCLVVGGHTIVDKEPKYGMAVIGTIQPERILRNRGAVPGDLLYLTKPLGTGIVATAIKNGKATAEEARAATLSMVTLNGPAAEAAKVANVRAMTDATGYGLVGHVSEMLGPESELGVSISAGQLPLLPGVVRHAKDGQVPGGTGRNRSTYQSRVDIAGDVPSEFEPILYDPQTSGGLLVAILPEAARAFELDATERSVHVRRIGTFDQSGRISVVW